MKNPVLIQINTTKELELFLRNHKIRFIPRRHACIEMKLSNLSEEENKKLSKRINFLYYYCGCGEGAFFLLLSLVAYFYYIFITLQGKISLLSILGGFLFLYLCTSIGKFAGILFSKLRLNSLANTILNTLELEV